MNAGIRTAVVLGVGLLCFAAGRWSGTADGRNYDTGSTHGERQRVSAGSPQGSRRERTLSGSLVEEARMPVPVAKVEELLVGMVGRQKFEYIDSHLDEALTLLGVTEEEAAAVKVVIKKLQQDILLAELEAVVVKEQTATGVTLDLTGVHDRLDGIRAGMAKGLRDALPAEKAELLVGAIQWKSLYTPVDFLQEVKFEIHRDAHSSHLRPMVWLLGGWDGRGTIPATYDNGSAIPAGEVFDWRWAKLMDGRTLVPVVAPDNGR